MADVERVKRLFHTLALDDTSWIRDLMLTGTFEPLARVLVDFFVVPCKPLSVTVSPTRLLVELFDIAMCQQAGIGSGCLIAVLACCGVLQERVSPGQGVQCWTNGNGMGQLVLPTLSSIVSRILFSNRDTHTACAGSALAPTGPRTSSTAARRGGWLNVVEVDAATFRVASSHGKYLVTTHSLVYFGSEALKME